MAEPATLMLSAAKTYFREHKRRPWGPILSTLERLGVVLNDKEAREVEEKTLRASWVTGDNFSQPDLTLEVFLQQLIGPLARYYRDLQGFVNAIIDAGKILGIFKMHWMNPIKGWKTGPSSQSYADYNQADRSSPKQLCCNQGY